jgi:hypothetical protein
MRKLIAVAALLIAVGAAAQSPQPSPRSSAETPRRAPLANVDEVEPAVDVGERRVAVIDRSAAPPPVAQASAPRTSPPAAAASAPPPAATQGPAETPSKSTEPPAPRVGTQRAIDTLDLGTTSITGNQELPKVLYIVPWKKSDLGDLVGRPVNTLLDEVLTPVDPEVFERHLQYYETLYGKSKEE